jgi:anti-sigma regulatory factor (Ser/Thr protein kinase)
VRELSEAATIQLDGLTLHALHLAEEEVAQNCQRYGFRDWSRSPRRDLTLVPQPDVYDAHNDVDTAAEEIATAGGPSGWGDSVIVFPADSPGALAAALALPARCCIENDVLVHDRGGVERLRRVEPSRSPGHSIDLLITARAAYDMQLAPMICHALMARGAIRSENTSNIALALHEAIANAIVHGCFEVEGFPRNSLEGFAAYSQSLQARRANPEFAHRVVEIVADWSGDLLQIQISDNGPGYAVPDGEQAPVADRLNRGLALIRAVTDKFAVDQGGCRATLWFARG